MSKTKPQNLIFIISDQHSRGKIGCYGADKAITPNIDRLAAEGTLFRNAYCNSPLCCPSRSSMITGDYAFRNHFWDNQHSYSGEVPGFGHVLTANNHRITTMGKLHYKGVKYDLGLPDQRFPLHVKDGTGSPYGLIREPSSARPALFRAASEGHVGESEYTQYDRRISDNAVEFLKNEAGNTDKPWVLFLGYTCPHFPLIVPEEYYRMYDGVELPDPIQFSQAVHPQHPVLHAYRVFIGSIYADMGTARKIVRLYYGLQTFLDAQIGKVLNAVKELGLADNTRIIYTSDHGDMVGDHALFMKNCAYEGSVGVPMIISGADVEAGRVVDTPVSLVDVYPTILDCVGCPNPGQQNRPGRSMLDIMQEPTDMERPVFAEYSGGGALAAEFMLRKGKWKYVCYPGFAPLLFNLNDDPNELTNLADDGTYSEILADCDRELRKICDPEKTDALCRKEQTDMVNACGGRMKVLGMDNFVVWSPTPKD